jgi:hypothetical protein
MSPWSKSGHAVRCRGPEGPVHLVFGYLSVKCLHRQIYSDICSLNIYTNEYIRIFIHLGKNIFVTDCYWPTLTTPHYWPTLTTPHYWPTLTTPLTTPHYWPTLTTGLHSLLAYTHYTTLLAYAHGYQARCRPRPAAQGSSHCLGIPFIRPHHCTVHHHVFPGSWWYHRKFSS